MIENIMELAKNNGFKGDSQTEAKSWLYAISKGMDMSEDARLERASQLGFNIDTVYYHGTSEQFDRFNVNKIGNNYNEAKESGFFFTKKEKIAIMYAERHSSHHNVEGNGRILSVFLKFNNTYKDYTNSDYRNPIERYDDNVHDFLTEVNCSEKDSILITGTNNDDLCIVFDPNQILSKDAAFDPETESYLPIVKYNESFNDFILENDTTNYNGYRNSELYLELDDYMNKCFKFAFQENKNAKLEEITSEFSEVIEFFELDERKQFIDAMNECIENNYNKEKANYLLKENKINNNITLLIENSQKINEVLENKVDKKTKKIKQNFN